MRKIHTLAVLFAAFSAGGAAAAPVSVQVIGADGRPLAGAVVTLTMPNVASPSPRGSYVMAQRNIAFEPHLLIVPVGATVTFPNFDRVRHHVYSFSQPKKFDLKLFGRDESRSIVFDRPGAVALGCNIHDAMSGIIFVTASPYTETSDAAGRVRMTVAAAGSGTMSVWHPSIRSRDNMLTQRVVIAPAGLSTTLQLRR